MRIWLPADGLGPAINARSCSGCHDRPSVGGSGKDERALVVLGSDIIDPSGGHVFRRLRISSIGAITERSVPLKSVLRRPPALFGSGLVEKIPLDTITARADPSDADGDGISGRVPVGRFGWKGRFSSIRQAVAAAYANEFDMENELYPAHGDGPIEVSSNQLDDTASFVRSLCPMTSRPPRRPIDAGQRMFRQIGCGSCHTPSYTLADGSEIRPFSDFLLHNMGLALADGVTEGNASGDEFKTPPLWGSSQTGPPFLHDGRAKTVGDAIAAHGGEAQKSAEQFKALPAADKAFLVAFLASL